MKTPAEPTPEPSQRYGCFWIAGWGGALMITLLALGEMMGSPGPDGPFGGIIWLIGQGTCLLLCLTFAIKSAFDPSVSTAQRKNIWLLTLYPILVFFLLMATGG